MIGAHYVDPIVTPLIVDTSFRAICDLGCGTASRLLRIAKQRPEVIARGVDIDARTIDLARNEIERQALSHRIEIVRADVRKLWDVPGIGNGIDFLLMCFMGHDLWPRERATKVFGDLRTLFPQCRRFLLADTVRGESVHWDEYPNFQLPFEIVHSIERKVIPALSDWEQLFEATAWRLQGLIPLGVPNSFVFDLAP